MINFRIHLMGNKGVRKNSVVSIDLWKAYKSLVEELMPSAQVVADRFHVMTQVNNELVAQRKQQKREAQKNKSESPSQEILASLTNSKYALLKNNKKLNEQQKLKLEQVQKICLFLGRMHEII